MLMLSFTSFFVLAIVSCFITTIGEILFFSVSQLICYEKGTIRKKGHSLGMYRMVFAASRAIGPATGSLVYQRLGGDMLWYLCGFFWLFMFYTINIFSKV
jgi:predicted MFS family arabinose efflux permease